MWVDTEDLSPNMACKPVRGRGLILFVILLALMPTQTASAKIVPTTRVVLDDLDWPVQLTFTPDGRVLFIEKDTGQIRIVEADVLRPEPLLDVRLHIAPANETLAPEGLSGLLGLAIDPGFKNDPWIYVYYTYRNQQNLSWNRLERFLINGVTIVRAEVLLDGIPDGFDHNGGVLQFGPDGMLYITTGDAFQPSLAASASCPVGEYPDPHFERRGSLGIGTRHPGRQGSPAQTWPGPDSGAGPRFHRGAGVRVRTRAAGRRCRARSGAGAVPGCRRRGRGFPGVSNAR